MDSVILLADDAPDHREIPLTLAFKPDNLRDDDPNYDYEAIALVQPSMEEEGRIFVGINPFGKAVGVHMLPEDARRVRDHLSKLLLEPEPEPDAESVEDRIKRALERKEAPVVLRPHEHTLSPEQALIAAGATSAPRVAARRRLFPSLQFHIEYRWGKLQGILARLDGS